MTPERLAVAWFLVIVLGLLLGLLIVVLAFGLARHARRQRPKPESSKPRGPASADEGDTPVEWRRPPGGDEPDE